MEQLVPLCSLRPGQHARVCRLDTPARLRRRLLDMGLTPGSRVTCIGHNPGSDPTAYLICHAVVAIRRCDAATVWVDDIREEGDHGAD